MRKGIALIITLAMLATLSLLVLKSFEVSGKFLDDSKELKLMYQANRLVVDSKDILAVTFQDVNDTEAYEFIFSQPFPVNGEDMQLLFTFSPIDNRANINHLLSSGKIDQAYYSLFEDIMFAYNVSDTDFFLQLVADTIDSDDKERSYGTELIGDDPFFTNGSVSSMEHFEKLLDFYVKERDDKNIYKIPWEKFISFTSKNIDINFATLELLKYLLPNYHIDKTFKETYYEKYEDLTLNEDEVNILKKLDVVFVTSRLHADTIVNNFDDTISFSFDYDVANKSLSDIKYNF